MNNGRSKNPKKLTEISVQIGRNQSVQHCAANFIRKTLPSLADRIVGEKPTRAEFLSLLWDEIESLVSDIHEYIEMEEKGNVKPLEKPKNTRKTLF